MLFLELAMVGAKFQVHSAMFLTPSGSSVSVMHFFVIAQLMIDLAWAKAIDGQSTRKWSMCLPIAKICPASVVSHVQQSCKICELPWANSSFLGAHRQKKFR
jgi:hypothetical protein